MEALRGQTALVVGATGGIGRATAGALVQGGAWVGMVARSESRLQAAAAEVGGLAIPVDISSPAGVHQLAEYLADLLGDAPDLVINAAGAFSVAPIAETDPVEFDRLLSINLRGAFLLARAFLPSMLARRSGYLINIGSAAAESFLGESGAYSPSIYGLRGLHRALAREIAGTGVRASLVETGVTESDLQDALDLEHRSDPASRGGMLRPEAVAGVVLMVASQPADVAIPFVSVQASR